MASAVTNIAVMIGVNSVVKKIPFDEHPEYVTYARVAYFTAQALCLLINYYCSLKIKKANDLTVLKYVSPKSPMSQEPGELVTTTHRDYDLQEVSKAMRGVYMGMLMVLVMHFGFKYTQPLIIQSLLPIKNAFESKHAQIWIFGKPASGELKRPFKAPAGPFGMGGGAGPATDAASIKEAEKAGAIKKSE